MLREQYLRFHGLRFIGLRPQTFTRDQTAVYAAMVCRLMVSTPVIYGLLLIYQLRKDGRLSWPGTRVSMYHSGFRCGYYYYYYYSPTPARLTTVAAFSERNVAIIMCKVAQASPDYTVRC